MASLFPFDMILVLAELDYIKGDGDVNVKGGIREKMQEIVFDTQNLLGDNDVKEIEKIRESRRKRLIIAMLTAYGDDSSDAKGVRTFAVAGIMGTQEEWDAIKPGWVRRTGGKIFHATDCEAGYGEYRNISKDERLKEYADLTKILAQTKMFGVGCAMDIRAYKTFIPDPHENGPYYYCFNTVIRTLAQTASLHIPQQTVKFIFDINHKVKYNAAFLYENYLTKRKDFEYTSFLEDELGYATNKTIEIQVADLFAHETMKYFDNQLILERPAIRKSLDALFNTDRFICIIYDKDFCESFKKKYEEFEKKLEKVGFPREHYEQWLAQHNCQDNCENKTRYLIELELKENH